MRGPRVSGVHGQVGVSWGGGACEEAGMKTAGELHLAWDVMLLVNHITSCKQAIEVCDYLECDINAFIISEDL